ncbi:MAG: EscU/YscU/HrcU family type III secretion system export apparatus switch protein [Candidatus Gastranaerophilales bacterium]|nr:EscU/YscU/HrcU family type III secretion system export apparatus switch protein [Candidatus Gastranaerophilales bacterium]
MGDEDKQFEASHQKLQKARKEGQVVKSKDFSTALALIVMFAAIYALGPFIWGQISLLYSKLYEQIPNAHLEEIGYMYILTSTLIPTFLIILPILILAGFMGILGDLIQVGPLFTITPLIPKPDKLNPTKYFKNLISPKTLFELVKNIAKVVILGFIGWVVYMEHFPAILMLAGVDNQFATLIAFGKLIVDFIIKAGIAFLIIAAADYGVTKWKFMQDQKMSFKEVKDEYKNSEGDPHVKAALRQKRQQLLQRSMMDMVPEADFVVTNPIHIACALKYDAETMESPKLLAKGTELFAKKIKEIASEHNIPVIENPPVARAIFRMVEINQEVPPDLYKAVAEILIFVYNLKKKTPEAVQKTVQQAKTENQNPAKAPESNINPARNTDITNKTNQNLRPPSV